MNKRILVACPTAEGKDYALEKWVETAKSLTYDNYDIHLVDNSETSDYMNDVRERFGDVLTINRVSPSQYDSFRHALAKSHNRCSEKVLKEGYDYLLHLESDVFPPLDVIERLLAHKRKVVGALYHVELGEQSKLMIQEVENFGMVHRESYNLDETDLSFVDGTVKRVFSCGLGCILIHRSVLEKVPFRYEGDASVHPDSFFFGDLENAGINVFVDTSIYCEHQNTSMTRI